MNAVPAPNQPQHPPVSRQTKSSSSSTYSHTLSVAHQHSALARLSSCCPEEKATATELRSTHLGGGRRLVACRALVLCSQLYAAAGKANATSGLVMAPMIALIVP